MQEGRGGEIGSEVKVCQEGFGGVLVGDFVGLFLPYCKDCSRCRMCVIL